MRVATWNVTRSSSGLPRLLPWLDERQPDMVCLQETKLADEAFSELLRRRLAARGYAFAVHGQAQWNGVAILSRVGLDDVSRVCRVSRVSPAGGKGSVGDPAAASGCTRSTCRTAGSRTPSTTSYKLAWLAALRDAVAAARKPRWSAGHEHRAGRRRRVRPGRLRRPDARHAPGAGRARRTAGARGCGTWYGSAGRTSRVFSYWDYRAGMFHQDLGMRIDLILAGAPVAGRVRAAWVDRKARKGTAPSDHAPVIVDLDEAPDGDIGPVVPPPSARSAPRHAVKLPQSGPIAGPALPRQAARRGFQQPSARSDALRARIKFALTAYLTCCLHRTAFSESVNHVLGGIVTAPGEPASIVGQIRQLAATRGHDAVYRHVAVDGAERPVTWGWLDQRSSQLAGETLRDRGVGFGDRVGVWLATRRSSCSASSRRGSWARCRSRCAGTCRTGNWPGSGRSSNRVLPQRPRPGMDRGYRGPARAGLAGCHLAPSTGDLQ